MHTWCWCPYKMLYCQYKAQHQMQSTATQITTGRAWRGSNQETLKKSLISTLLNTNCFGVCVCEHLQVYFPHTSWNRDKLHEKLWRFLNQNTFRETLRLYHIHCCLIIHMRPHFTKRLQREIKEVYKASVTTKSNILMPVNPLFWQSSLIQQMHYIE